MIYIQTHLYIYDYVCGELKSKESFGQIPVANIDRRHPHTNVCTHTCSYKRTHTYIYMSIEYICTSSLDPSNRYAIEEAVEHRWSVESQTIP